MSADEDDKDDEYDSGIFPNRDVQKLHRIKQRKGRYFIQASSDDEDDQVDDLIAPYTLSGFPYPSIPPQNNPLLKPVCRFVSLFLKKRKSTSLRAFRA